MDYYYYHHGDYDFAHRIKKILDEKDFDAFVKEVEMEKARPKRKNDYCRLPDMAYDENDELVSVLKKENFMKIEHHEYEWG